MSVDTHLKGKRIGTNYRRFGEELGVEILVAKSLISFAYGVQLDTRWGVFGKRIKARVDHKHRPS